MPSLCTRASNSERWSWAWTTSLNRASAQVAALPARRAHPSARAIAPGPARAHRRSKRLRAGQQEDRKPISPGRSCANYPPFFGASRNRDMKKAPLTRRITRRGHHSQYRVAYLKRSINVGIIGCVRVHVNPAFLKILAQTQQSRHQGPTEGPTFRILGYRPDCCKNML
jgi:hypothetical protein